MADDLVLCDIADDVATLTLNDPATRNSLSNDMVARLGQRLNELRQVTPRIRCLVLTGAGLGFCSGGNLKAMNTDAGTVNITSSALQQIHHPFFRQLRDFPAPLITAVNGAAAGAGMSLALMGDIIVAGRSAYFLQAFRNVGLVPDCGSSWLLPRMIGLVRARELSLLGERLSAQQAFDWGLVTRLTTDVDLMDEACQIAEKIANGPLEAQTKIRRLYWASLHNSFEEQIDLEDRLQQGAKSGPEVAEGLAAFRSKRGADFRRVPS